MNASTKAKLLAECSLDKNGRIDPARVSAACAIAETEATADAKLAVLKKYRKLIEAELEKGRVVVESSAPLSDSALADVRKFVESRTGASNYIFERKVDPALIGGIRIICGDVIWERSAKQALESIK